MKICTTLMTMVIMVIAMNAANASSGTWVRGEDGRLHWERGGEFSLDQSPTVETASKDDHEVMSMSDYFSLGYFRGSNRLNGVFVEGRKPLGLGLHLSGSGMFMSEPKTQAGSSDRDVRHFNGALNFESWLPSRLTGNVGHLGLIMGYADGEGADDAIFRPGILFGAELWHDAEICVQLFPVSFGQKKDEETRSVNFMLWQSLDYGAYRHFEIFSGLTWAYQPINLMNASSHDSLEGYVSLGWELPALSNFYLQGGIPYSNNTPGKMRDKRWGYDFGLLFHLTI